VHSWWQIGLVFGTGLVALFSFAAATLRHFLKANRLHETALLLAVTLILFRPELMNSWLDLGGKYPWQGVGILLYAMIALLQWRRVA